MVLKLHRERCLTSPQLLLLFVVCTGEQLSALMKRPPIGPRANKNTAEVVNGINTKHAHLLASFNPIHTEHLLGAGCKGPKHENTVFCPPCCNPASRLGGGSTKAVPLLPELDAEGPGPNFWPFCHSFSVTISPRALTTSVQPPKLCLYGDTDSTRSYLAASFTSPPGN